MDYLITEGTLPVTVKIIPGLGTRVGVLYNSAVLRHKTTTKVLLFVFTFDSNNDPIVGSLVRNESRVFNDIHSRCQILEVSNDTSDTVK